MTARESIQITELELLAHVGVPVEERAQPQRLTISITLWPVVSFFEMADRVERTVNYAAVCQEVKEFVTAREDKLIETLADAVASHLLGRYPIDAVEIELRKFILPDVKHVAVSLMRTQPT